MTKVSRVTAWLSAWKWVLLLVLLLAMSVWLNVRQYGDKREAAAQARAQAYAEALATTAGIAKDAKKDSGQLLERLDAIAQRGERTRVVYQKAAAAQPLAANCAPGQARVDAINAGLGPQPENP